MKTMKDYKLDSGEREGYLIEDRIATDHLARYYYASEFIKNIYGEHSVNIFLADIFCGVGYGSNILARETNSVVLAIDGSEEAIIKASNAFSRANLIFSNKIFPFDLPLNTFDCVCSFESLEHILDYDLFARILVKSIKNNGYLLVSCPNENNNHLDTNPWQWHYKHLTPSEFTNLFQNLGMRLIEQNSTVCSITNSKGLVVGTNHYAIPENEILKNLSGDTMFFIFKKD